MAKVIDTNLTLEAVGPRGPSVLNNLRCLTDPASYLLDRIRPFSCPVVPVTNRNGSLVVIRGSDAVKQYFMDNETFQRINDGTFALPPNQPWSMMFDNLLTTNGHEHSRRRKLLIPAFHSNVLDEYRKVFVDTLEASRFTRSGNPPFDIVEEFKAIARANMLTCLLGLDARPAHLNLAERISQVFESMFSPFTMMFRWNYSWTPYRRWLTRVAETFMLLTQLIDQRRCEAPRSDALSVLCHTTADNGDQLTTMEIAGELHGLFVAGHETTAGAMIWGLLTCLSQPHAARENLDSFIKETERLIPTVPVTIPRRVTRDVRIGDIIVPANSVAIVSPLLEHRDPEVFPEPDLFVPERWKLLRPSPFSFLPFGVGRRRCIGSVFAEEQVSTTIKMILERGHWHLHTAAIDYTVKGGVMAQPRRPIYISSACREVSAPAPRGSLTKLWKPSAEAPASRVS